MAAHMIFFISLQLSDTGLVESGIALYLHEPLETEDS